MKKLSILIIWVIASSNLFGQAGDSTSNISNEETSKQELLTQATPDSLTGSIALDELVKELTQDGSEEYVWSIHDSKNFSHEVITNRAEAIYTLIVIFEEKNGNPNAMAIAKINGRSNFIYPKEPISSIPNGFNIQLVKFRSVKGFTRFTIKGGYHKKRSKGKVWAALIKAQE